MELPSRRLVQTDFDILTNVSLRIAQIFRERGVDISVPHLVRTIRRFIQEEVRAGRAGLRLLDWAR